MFLKCLVMLAASLALATAVVLQLPWRTHGTLRPGELRTVKSASEAVIHVQGEAHHYYSWAELAPRVQATAKVTGTGGLQVVEARTEVTAETVSWYVHTRSGSDHWTAPGAAIKISATAKAPEAGAGETLMKLEWWSPVLEQNADYRKGFEFKELEGDPQEGRILLGEFLNESAAGYWGACLRKAFFGSVPFAWILLAAGCVWVLGRPPKAEAGTAAGQQPLHFPASYYQVKLAFGMVTLGVCLPFCLFATSSLFSNQGGNLEPQAAVALWSLVGFAAPALTAWWVRKRAVKRVEVRAEGVLVDCGDGWGKTVEIPWATMTGAGETGNERAGRYLRIDHTGGPTLFISQYGTRDFRSLCEAVMQRFASSQKAEA